MRLSKKWLNATFSSFFHPVLAPMARSAPNAKYENLWVFIRSDAHVVRAGLNIRGCGPLSTLGFFDRLKGRLVSRPFISRVSCRNCRRSGSRLLPMRRT